jgi:hypothetical protein
MKSGPVTPDVRQHKLDNNHVCRDRWGLPHAHDVLHMLTMEHVKDQPRMGRRAPSDAAHLVAMCWGGNVGVPSKEQRQAIRAYLREVAV